jgi:hypothetical protein
MTLIQTGRRPARQVLKARILLKADASEAGEAWSDSQIAEALDSSIDTVARTRQQLVEGGLDAALTRKHSPHSARKRIFDGAAEAKLVTLACSEPPKGRSRWTLQLLEQAVVELNIVTRASNNHNWAHAEKTRLEAMGHPAGGQCHFRSWYARRAGGLSEAARSDAPGGMSRRDLQAADQRDPRVPIPAKPGRPARNDYEYARNGTANLFMMFAPLEAGGTSRSPTATPLCSGKQDGCERQSG